MSGWRQAVFLRQRRLDVIQRALSKILDEESWSPVTPRRLRVGLADASSRGWTMIVPDLANFFLDRGGTGAPRLCRLVRELHCPAYEVDVRDGVFTTLFEVDSLGQQRLSGSRMSLPAGLTGAGDAEWTGRDVASNTIGFGLLAIADEIPDRIRRLDREQPMALADYLGAIAGFPGWTRLALNHPAGTGASAGTRHGGDAIAAGELVYEPPRIARRAKQRSYGRAHATATLTTPAPETRAAIARAKPRPALPSHDRRGRQPRSAARPRR
ncbi:MAG TPA: hypothetical protein VHN14_18635 [Kofleriaceae bacterium]|jgi:hypothetical protein|nr:hypothetical protein [Kofleriaceae bacterium]